MCECVWVCVAAPLSYPRRLDLPAGRNVNYFANLQAHSPQSLPSPRKGDLSSAIQEAPLQIQDRASDSDLFSRKGVNGISRTIQTESRAWIKVPSLLAALFKNKFFSRKQLERWRIINALKWIVTAGCKVFGLSGNFKQTWNNETDRILINKPHFKKKIIVLFQFFII